MTQLGVHSSVEVHSSGGVACHCGISVPSVPSFAFGAMGITCGAVCSTGWVLLHTVGSVLGGCRWWVTITIVTGVGCSMLVMADCIHRFGAMGDLFSGVLKDKVFHCDVS